MSDSGAQGQAKASALTMPLKVPTGLESVNTKWLAPAAAALRMALALAAGRHESFFPNPEVPITLLIRRQCFTSVSETATGAAWPVPAMAPVRKKAVVILKKTFLIVLVPFGVGVLARVVETIADPHPAGTAITL